jgi:MFS family permease
MHGLYLLWWVQEKGVSPALVAAILAAGDLALIGLELPTGWFADRCGHRASLMLGSFVQVVGMLCCWLSEGVPGLLAASVLVAMGDAFRSGADQALLYRTCLAVGREAEFQQIEARAESINLAALVLLVLAGGVIVQQGGFVLGWVAETILCGAGLLIAHAMVEPPSTLESIHQRERTTDPSRIQYRRLASAIAPAALLGGAASATAFLAQTRPAHPFDITMLVAAFTAAEAAGSALAARLPNVSTRIQIRLAALGVMVSTTAIVEPALLGPVAIAAAFLAGVIQPLRAVSLQRLSTDNMRARAASAASACDMIVSAVLLPIAGLWAGRRKA